MPIKRYELTGDENALELARGYVNYLLGHSRYFSYNMEFTGASDYGRTQQKR